MSNIRLSYSKDPTTNVLKILEENHYYPFGLKHNNYNSDLNAFKQSTTSTAVQLKAAAIPAPIDPVTNTLPRYKYNGKEFQDELGLNMYDYGWRNYMPDVGRWTQIDPLFNDLKFANDVNTVDPDDRAAVYMSIINDLELGGGIYNTDNLNPYGYGYNNPVSFDDPDGRCPACLYLLAALLYTEFANAPTKNPKADAKNYNNADRAIVSKAILTRGQTVTGVSTSQMSTSIKLTQKELKQKTLKENSEKGAKFENAVAESIKNDGTSTNIQTQVSIKPEGGSKNVKVDVVSTNNGNINLTEAKSSSTAPLTKNQKEGYPLIEKNGGTIVGQGKPGYEGGTKIGPTKVDVIRPN